MKVLVTGGSGFVGHNLCLSLEKLDWDVVVIDNYSSGHRNNVTKNGRYVEDSILHTEYLRNLVSEGKFDTVFHFAAIPRVSYSVEHPVETTHANVIGTLNILDVLKTYSPDTRFILSSSSSVYGGKGKRPTSTSAKINPQSPYALQKAQSEMWCRMYSEMYGLDTVILRYFNVFGEHSRFGGPYTTVLGAWLYSLFVDLSIRPYLEGDGKQSRDFCAVENVVSANLAAAMRKERFKGEAVNIAQGEGHTLLECKELLESIAGESLDLEKRPIRKGDVKHTLASISEANDILGYEPKIDFEGQVKEMAKWYETDYSIEVSSSKIAVPK